MALADIENELTGIVPARTCTVCFHMAERGPEWAARFRRMLANRAIAFSELARKLADDPDEPSIDRQSIGRHARGECLARERLR